MRVTNRSIWPRAPCRWRAAREARQRPGRRSVSDTRGVASGCLSEHRARYCDPLSQGAASRVPNERVVKRDSRFRVGRRGALQLRLRSHSRGIQTLRPRPAVDIVLFAGSLMLNPSFARERQNDTLDALRMAPISPFAIFRPRCSQILFSCRSWKSYSYLFSVCLYNISLAGVVGRLIWCWR